MSDKKQITSNVNNRLIVHLLKNSWATNSRLTRAIDNLEEWKSIEEEKLKKISNPIEGKKQIDKIRRIMEVIKREKQARDTNLEKIRNISSILSRTTC